MNNKNITILTISVLSIAIAILVLTICKGKEMKEWLKKNILCCFGKKEEEKKDVKIQTEQPVNRVTMKQIDDLQRKLIQSQQEIDKNFAKLDKNKEELDKNKKELDKNKEEIQQSFVDFGNKLTSHIVNDLEKYQKSNLNN